MTRASALDFWEMPHYQALYESLGLLAPARTWQLLNEVRNAELQAFETDDLVRAEQRARRSLRLAPAVADSHDVDVIAAEFARYMQARYFDCVFLGIYARTMLSDAAFARGLCDAVGIETLDDLHDRAILLPLHMGPYPVLVPFVAARHPVTTILDGAALAGFRGIKAAYLPELDIEEIAMPDRRVLLRCLRALRAGRWLCMFPEFSWGYDQPKRSVPFLGTRVDAPEGAHRLAQQTRSPLVVCSLVSDGPAHFVLKVSEPFFVGPGERGIEAAVSRTFEIIETSVLDNPGSWQGWDFFDELVTAENGRGPLPFRIGAEVDALPTEAAP